MREMMAKIVLGVLACGMIIFRPASAPGEGAPPEELHRQAYLAEREGRMALYADDLPGAYESFARSAEIFREISRSYPDWRPEAVRARVEALTREAETIGRKIFSLPDGVVEIEAGMVREGRRYDEGRSDASRVKPAGDDQYEIADFTVIVVREGPLVGASCACPDFTYRGKRHGFVCKHIWAVVIREKLIE